MVLLSRYDEAISVSSTLQRSISKRRIHALRNLESKFKLQGGGRERAKEEEAGASRDECQKMHMFALFQLGV